MFSRFRITAAIFLVSVLLLAGCGPSNSSGGGGYSSVRHMVTIVDFKFAPRVVRIHVGDSVEWTNRDKTYHTVTSDTGAWKDSGEIEDSGGTFRHVFMRKGDFMYHCRIHPHMPHGEVVVT